MTIKFEVEIERKRRARRPREEIRNKKKIKIDRSYSMSIYIFHFSCFIILCVVRQSIEAKLRDLKIKKKYSLSVVNCCSIFYTFLCCVFFRENYKKSMFESCRPTEFILHWRVMRPCRLSSDWELRKLRKTLGIMCGNHLLATYDDWRCENSYFFLFF
jgi:hypothetical protein